MPLATPTEERLERKRLSQKKYDLKRDFGISLQDYERMLAEQGGRCAICGADEVGHSDPERMWYVDHCHQTGKVRGLLCMGCNAGLGFLDDDTERMRRAVDYLGRQAE